MTTILFGGLLIPFILITDIFPFLRFGMFAEPVKKAIQTERFVVLQTDLLGRQTIFNPENIGINPNTFHYLCRNYYYRNETSLLADKIFASSTSPVSRIVILQIITNQNTLQVDTLKIGTYITHE
ncbi:MAG TPA: hypothetical protein VK766_12315 [Cytophagaceae bacterium]|nr:hypothetical protein [Cytophagaceae bacterium]